jgi:hypothetical protein
LEPWAKHTTGDTDIRARRWLPLDFDPKRASGISSTDEEHEAAIERARQCRDFLVLNDWPEPIVADSGNGAHLLFRIDLPNDDNARTLLQRLLESLAVQFSDDVVAVDRTTFNAARIWKLYGTPARKGEATADRPHRLARILEYPPWAR